MEKGKKIEPDEGDSSKNEHINSEQELEKAGEQTASEKPDADTVEPEEFDAQPEAEQSEETRKETPESKASPVEINANEDSDAAKTTLDPSKPTALSNWVGLRSIFLLALLAIVFISSIIANIIWLSKGAVASAIPVLGYVAFSVLLILSVLSVALALWLAYSRTVLLRDGPALVPSEWGGIVEGAAKESYRAAHVLDHQTVLLRASAQSQEEKFDKLMESFLTMQSALDVRDQEISRFKKGYDAKVFKRFLGRFLRVHRALAEMSAEAKTAAEKKNSNYALRLMSDALEECGLEEFQPELGHDYRELGDRVADDPETRPSSDPAQDFTIAEVIQPGFLIEGEGDEEIVVRAKVAIFRNSK